MVFSIFFLIKSTITNIIVSTIPIRIIGTILLFFTNSVPFTLPNDILGLEYVKAIVNNNYPIKAFCIKRTNDFHSMIPSNNIASATYIRKLIFDNNLEYKQFTPMIFDKVPDRIENYYSNFQHIVKNTPNEELKKIKLISEGMENLFKKHIDAPSYDEFVNRVNSKRYTSSRIKRTMLYVLLNIKQEN